MSSQGSILARRHIAKFIDLTDRRVMQLMNEGVLQEYSPGLYQLIPTVHNYIHYLRTPSESKLDKPRSDLDNERERLAKIKREDAELDLQVKKNELHRSTDVEFIMTNMLIAFKAKLEVLPYKVLPSIISIPNGEDKADYITGILKSAVEEALNELSEYNPALFDEEAYLAGLDDTVAEEVLE